MTTDDIYVRLNNIVDKATESLIIISEEHEKQNTYFSNLIDDVKVKNNSLTDNYSALDTKITELGCQIKDIEGVLELLQKKQNTTELAITALQTKAKKRKWWKLL
jgi:hypothetical protein